MICYPVSMKHIQLQPLGIHGRDCSPLVLGELPLHNAKKVRNGATSCRKKGELQKNKQVTWDTGSNSCSGLVVPSCYFNWKTTGAPERNDQGTNALLV